MTRWIPGGEIPEGEGRCYDVDGQHVAVFNRGGSYYAMTGTCANAQESLPRQGSLEKVFESCPHREWPFDMQAGPCNFEPRVVQELQTCESQARWWEGKAAETEVEVNPPGQ